MPSGWIRSYAEEVDRFGFVDRDFRARNQRAEFRRDFTTQLRETATQGGTVLRELRWGDVVELPSGISTTQFTRAESGGQIGFVPTAHVVELAYVNARPEENNGYQTRLTYRSGGEDRHRRLIWGDCVQIMARGDEVWWADSYAEAIREAQQTQKPLFLEFRCAP